ncbi:ganglioside GM2 activator [Biomphalaria pfeifferi]|uniref:Ganglioside GM2 activator n=1 Tax=Biomphalaria pfeifferi TaxID=112525 RepID=A0AAD8ARJ0_BIOPF|nr:ganglioside GM2 activator [Biomphalaria pfeifferi]
MASVKWLVLFSLCCYAVSSEPLYVLSQLEQTAHEEFKALVSTLLLGKKPEHSFHKEHRSRLKSFSFKNCAIPQDEILVPSNINVTPDPINIPGNITISGGLLINKPFGAPLITDIVVEKEVFGHWIKIPCIDQIGSCTYPDMCATVNVQNCPPQFINVGLPCKCPFPAGNFNIQPFDVNINNDLPFKISGGVKVQINATFNGALVTCVALELDLA